MRLLTFLSLFLISVIVVTSQAEAFQSRFSGAYLMEICDANKDGSEKVKGGHAACQSYIAGVLDYHKTLQSMKIAPQVDICVPANVTMKDLHGVILKYMKRNVQHDGFVAAPAVTLALFDVYPCP